MSHNRNFWSRALDAIIAGRQREAKRYLARHQADERLMNKKLTRP